MITFIKNKFTSISKLEWLLFFFVFFAYGFFYNEYPSWNDKTRMNLIFAIVEQGRLEIDSYWDKPGYDTFDVAFYRGHYYCDKSPILSFLGVPVYWLWRGIHDLFGIYFNPLKGRYPVILFTVSLPSAILSLLLYRFLGSIRKKPNEQFLLTLFYAFGTIVFPFSFLFFAHQTASVFMFAGFYFLYRYLHPLSDSTVSRPHLFLPGFLAGLGFATEPPTGIILAGLTLYLWFQLKDKKQILWYFIGIGIPILIILVYNLVCFRNPLHSGYEFELLDRFKEGMSKGLMGITYPKWKAIWGVTFSQFRGLFFYCPILLMAIPGFFYFFKEKEFRKEGFLILYIVLAFFYFNFSYYEWTGGWSIGPRHIIPMLSFIIIPVYFFMARWKRTVIFTGFLSILLIMLPTFTEPQFPKEIIYPYKDFVLPRIMASLKEFSLPVVNRGILELNILSILFGIRRVYAITIWIVYWIAASFLLYRISSKDQLS